MSNMRTVILFFTLLLPSLSSFSQDKEKEAQYYFTKAETFYNEGSFVEAFNALVDCENVLGKSNSKILYMRIKSSDGAYKARPDSIFVNNIKLDINLFFEITNADNYPATKYFEIIDLKKTYFEIDEIKTDWKAFRIKNSLYKLSEASKYNELEIEFEKCCLEELNLMDDFTKSVIEVIIMNSQVHLSKSVESAEEREKFYKSLNLLALVLEKFPAQNINEFSKNNIAERVGYTFILYHSLFFIDEIGAKSKKLNTPDAIRLPIRQALLNFKNKIIGLQSDKVAFFITDTKYYHYYNERMKEVDAYRNLAGNVSGNTTLTECLPFTNLK